MVTLTFNIQPVKSTWTGTVYIRADGSIDPPDAPIITYDYITYTLADNINSSADGIAIERDNIVLDGAGYTLQGTGNGKGIYLSYRSNVTIKNMEIKAFGYGVYLGSSSNYNTVSGNNITNNGCGIMLYYSSNNSIVGNIIKNNGWGIGSYISWNNFVNNNVITDNNRTGIVVSYYPGTIKANWTITNNIITLNKLFGISLQYAGGNLLRNNTITDNEFSLNVGGQPPEDYVQDIDASNTVNGKPIYYWINQHSKLVPADSGYVAVVNSTNIIVKNFNLTRNGPGMIFINVFNSTIENMNISNNHCNGIYLWNCSDIIIRCNRIDNSTIGGGRGGISLIGSGDNKIDSNILTHNYEGIHVSYALTYPADRNFITENMIMNNDRGIYLYESSDNVIFHNNIINNTRQVYIDLGNINNTWDDGYPSGGNYWSDYAGVDLYSGPYQNETGSDGIGDTPYVIDANNVDHYPLMNPWSPKPPTPPYINASVDINPNTLNLRSKGKWITAYIELPEGYDVRNINVSSIMLNDTIPVEPKPIAIGDYDNDTIPDLMIKFNRQAVIRYVLDNVDIVELFERRFTTATLTITGYLNDGTQFQGSTTTKIIMPMPRGIGRHIFPI